MPRRWILAGLISRMPCAGDFRRPSMNRVAHVTSSISAQGGGIAIALQALAAAQFSVGETVSVIGHQDGGSPCAGWPEGSLHGLVTRRLPGMAWSTGMFECIESFAPEILHTHGLWCQASITVPRYARRQRRPYLVSPHGMLDAWALGHSALKKRLAARVFERSHLTGAACVHALCASEAESIRSYGVKNPVCVIPNGVDLPERLEAAEFQSQAGPRVLLFLGRLHPKKGLVNLIKAWATIQRAEDGRRRAGEWVLAIAGWDQGGHAAELKQLCDELGLPYSDISAADYLARDPSPACRPPSSILFIGPAFGEQKAQLLRRASAFILPSFSEGLPMSVLEAWSYGLPVLMTDRCNLPEGFAADAAIRIGTEVDSIAGGLVCLFRSAVGNLRAMGANGRRLVESRFTWDQVAAQMKAVYEWALSGGPAPKCVVLL